MTSSSSYTSASVVRRKSTHGSRGTRSHRASETVEIRRDRSPVRVKVKRTPSVREPVIERVIVEERRESPRRERSLSRGSDEIVVIEDHSPPRRKKSHRDRNDRDSIIVEESEEVRRESGYRTVDPLSYGGAVGGSGGRRGSGR